MNMRLKCKTGTFNERVHPYPLIGVGITPLSIHSPPNFMEQKVIGQLASLRFLLRHVYSIRTKQVVLVCLLFGLRPDCFHFIISQPQNGFLDRHWHITGPHVDNR